MKPASIPVVVWLVPPVLLCLAFIPLPYLYYSVQRLVVFAAALVIAGAILAESREPPALFWAIGFVVIALVFNPIVPLRLRPQLWKVLDLAAAAGFLAHWWLVRRDAQTAPPGAA